MDYQFDEQTCKFLKAADKICATYMSRIHQEAVKLALKNEEVVFEPEDQMIIDLSRAFGILYNKAIEVGLINDGTLVENRKQEKVPE